MHLLVDVRTANIPSMKILFFAGSLRKDSLNKKLVNVAKDALNGKAGVEGVFVDLKELAIPVYDGDIEAQEIPEGVRKLGQMVSASQALVVASPEYNGAISSPLKNTIDWISRLKPVPFEKKCVLLMGASPGAFGAIRALSQGRVSLDALGAYVYPQVFGLPKAHEAFSSQGGLVDVTLQKRLDQILTAFLDYSERLQS